MARVYGLHELSSGRKRKIISSHDVVAPSCLCGYCQTNVYQPIKRPKLPDNNISSALRTEVSRTQDRAENEYATQSWQARIENEYVVGRKIGSGSFGSVYAGFRKGDGLPVAIKIIGKNLDNNWGEICGAKVPIEFQLLKKVSGHPGVIKMIDWFEVRDYFMLVMERPAPVTDLYDYLERYGALPEKTAYTIIFQLIRTVRHCHVKGVIHRDIKDENVLLNLRTMKVQLIDFGCGAVSQILPHTRISGTPMYSPSEWYQFNQYIGTDFDVWGLGVLLFILVEGCPPFTSKKEIVEKEIVFNRQDLSQSCQDLIRQMLSKDPSRRPHFIKILRHPWLEGAGRL